MKLSHFFIGILCMAFTLISCEEKGIQKKDVILGLEQQKGGEIVVSELDSKGFSDARINATAYAAPWIIDGKLVGLFSPTTTMDWSNNVGFSYPKTDYLMGQGYVTEYWGFGVYTTAVMLGIMTKLSDGRLVLITGRLFDNTTSGTSFSRYPTVQVQLLPPNGGPIGVYHSQGQLWPSIGQNYTKLPGTLTVQECLINSQGKLSLKCTLFFDNKTYHIEKLQTRVPL